ncbi:MAG: hypothetical protein L0H64_12335 [Pseudonocardia sp.]|nr:hypothetical protein [Pseudonocardia sp.]
MQNRASLGSYLVLEGEQVAEVVPNAARETVCVDADKPAGLSASNVESEDDAVLAARYLASREEVVEQLDGPSVAYGCDGWLDRTPSSAELRRGAFGEIEPTETWSRGPSPGSGSR